MSTQANERMRHVTSAQNALVKELRRAFGRSEKTPDGYCAIESVRVVEEAIRSGLKFKAVFVSASAEERSARLLPQIGSRVEVLLVPDEVFRSAVATETPQGVAALVKLHEGNVDAALSAARPLLVAVAGLQDPGNLGTIMRSAEAFGATAVLLGKGTVSPLNPKVVRAAAGSLFRMNVIECDLAGVLQRMSEHGIRRLGTSSHKGTAVHDTDLRGAVALVIGNEGAGLGRELSHLDGYIAVPHSPRVESLNAAVATSILLYEGARQRGTFSE